MGMNPFHKPLLRAMMVGQQEADPTSEIEFWLGQLAGVLQGAHDDDSSLRAYVLLSSRWALHRVQPSLLDQELVKQADELIQLESEMLCQNAFVVMNPTAWRDELEQMIQLTEEGDMTATEAARLQQQLVSDLDEADLVMVAGRDLGHADKGLAEELVACNHLLVEHTRLFADAGVFTQSVALSFRPDLPESLKDTGKKWLALLDALEDCVLDDLGVGVDGLDPEGIRSLVARENDQPTS